MSAPYTRNTTRLRRQRGSIHVASAAGLLAAVFAAALAIDVGRVALERRRLQLQADIAALEASRRVGHCVPAEENPASAAQAAAARNGWNGSDVNESPNRVAIGEVESVDGLYQFTATGDAATATAVEVTLASSMPRSAVAGAFFPGTLELTASAVGQRVAAGGLRAGSRLATVDSDRAMLLDELLGEMLDSSVTLDALSYQGLADAHVSIGDLVEAHASAGTVDELLALELGAGEYLQLVASALQRAGNDSAAATVNDLAASTGSPGSVEMGELISVGDGGDEAVLRSSVNAFDMVMFGSQFAARDSALSIDGPVISIPGVGDADLVLSIVEPPQIAVGPPGQDPEGNWRTRARTAQMRIGLRAESATPVGMIGGPPLGLDFYAMFAPTTASLTTVECGVDSNVHRARVLAEPGAATYGMGRFQDIENSDEVEPSTLVDFEGPGGMFTLRASGQSAVSATSAAEELIFDGPFVPEIDAPAENQTQTVGAPLGAAVADGLANVADGTEVEVVVDGTLPVGITQPDLEQAVRDAATPLLTSLDQMLTPTLEALGVHLGGADVTVGSLSVRPPLLVR